MVFNIGSQSGGVINNVGRDQHVSGVQQGTQVSLTDAQGALDALRIALEQTDLAALTDEQRAAVDDDLDTIGQELATPEPARAEIRPRLTRLTQLLTDAGALVGAGAALRGPLTTLAHWLGPIAASVL